MNFIQNWMACANVIERIPPMATATTTTTQTTRPPAHDGAPVWVARVSPAPRNCGTRYSQPMSTTSTQAASRTAREPSRISAKSGSVYAPERRSGAATRASRIEVAGGVPDRVPQHVEAVREHESRDAQEGRGGQVLPADRGSIPAWRDRAGGHVEVAGRPGPAQAEGAGGHRRHRHQGDGRDGLSSGAHVGPDRRTSVSLRSDCRTRNAASPMSAG